MTNFQHKRYEHAMAHRKALIQELIRKADNGLISETELASQVAKVRKHLPRRQ